MENERLNFGLFMIGFFGTEPTPELLEQTTDPGVAGIILFGRNIINSSQVSRLISGLQEARHQAELPPLLTAIDQEGGVVVRLHEGVTIFPGNRALGEGGKEKEAFRQGEITGRELAYWGINMNLAPVLDLYTIPGNPSTGLRAIGSNPEKVSRLGVSLALGLMKGGVIPVVKHFPGKGAASVDSHLGLPVINNSETQLLCRDLIPFQAALKAKVPALMVSHAAYPQLEGGKILPATISYRVQTVLLREKLGFSGVSITDDLGMGALNHLSRDSSPAVKALAAGADLLLMCHSPLAQKQAISLVAKQIRLHPNFFARASQAVKNIETLVRQIPSQPKKIPQGGAELAESLARKALRLFRDPGNLIPLKSNLELLIIFFSPTPITGVEEQAAQNTNLSCFSKLSSKTEKLIFPVNPPPQQSWKETNKSSDDRIIIFCSFDAYRFEGQQKMIKRLPRDKVIGIALRDPRDIKLFPPGWTVLATHGYSPASLAALVKKLSEN